MKFDFFRGFREAFRGLHYLLKEERHFRFQVAVTVALIAVMIILPLTYAEVGFIIVGITLVLATEAANTVIERMMDSISTQRKHWIGQIKDIMASAVLLSSIGALCIGIITLLHYGMRIFGVASLRELDRVFSFTLNTWAGKIMWEDLMIIFFASALAWILVAVFLIALVVSRIRFQEKIYYLASAVLAVLVGRFGVIPCIWYLHSRVRPFMAMPVHQLIAEQGNSFPSGHATVFFALSVIAFSFNEKLGFWFFAASVVMGIARVMAGVHYASDIIAGMIIGVVVAWIALRVVSMFEKMIY